MCKTAGAEQTMEGKGQREHIIRLFNFSIPVLLLIWAVVPYSKSLAALLPSIAAFFTLLTARSFELFIKRRSDRQFSGTFWNYLLEKRALLQNSILAFVLGSSGLVVEAFSYAARTGGGILLLSIFDATLLILIFIVFFRRPGVKRTLSRSFPADPETSKIVSDLTAKLGMKAPELRIVPSGRGNRANAFSWSLPNGNSYIFANEDLFMVLSREEVGAIFTHELGHIRARHSEKSFLLSTLVPLLWVNLIAAPFALFDLVAAAAMAGVAFAVAFVYLVYRRGYVSRRFEKDADIFAARNYDREVYLASLKKLARSRDFGTSGISGNFTSHDSIEERERLIRSL